MRATSDKCSSLFKIVHICQAETLNQRGLPCRNFKSYTNNYFVINIRIIKSILIALGIVLVLMFANGNQAPFLYQSF